MLKNKTVFTVALVFACLIFWEGFAGADETSYDPGKRRDPFVPLLGDAGLSEAGSSQGLKLEGIIYDPAVRSMVILNGKSYLAGDAVEDATVVKIEKDHVVISVDGEEKTLWMRGGEKEGMEGAENPHPGPLPQGEGKTRARN